MSIFIKVPERKLSFLEKFGLYYLKFFKKEKNNTLSFELSDESIKKKTRKIILKGTLLSSLVGITTVFPTIWLDLQLHNDSFWIHYAWVIGATLIFIIIELYILFIIALKLVYDISKIVDIGANENDFLKEGIFSIESILARTALEIPDPELEILGIDPFKRISKKNLFVIGLIYKAKIFLTNFILRNILYLLIGSNIMGISILYIALPVECFWNIVVIKRVINEARLRLFGFALANKIIAKMKSDNILSQLSIKAKAGCMRAIGNAVVMTQNYHSNMIILLVSFQQLLEITKEDKYDDWSIFVNTLNEVNERERYFLLDLFTIAAAFDGKLSKLEKENLKEVYKENLTIYYDRLNKLISSLKKGEINKALQYCELDFNLG